MLDLKPVLPVLLALASAAFTAAMPFVVPLLRRALHVHINAAQASIVDLAVKRGAGLALRFIEANDNALSAVPLHNAALANGAEYVLKMVPGTLAALGVTPDRVQQMVHAELGRLVGGAYAPPDATKEMAPQPKPMGSSPTSAPAAPAAQEGGAVAKALGAVAILCVMGLGAGALSGCTAQQAATAKAIAQQACLVDGVVVPLAQPAVAALGGTGGATLAAVDASALHPAVVAACAKLNGTPVVAPVTVVSVGPTAGTLAAAPVPAPAAPAK